MIRRAIDSIRLTSHAAFYAAWRPRWARTFTFTMFYILVCGRCWEFSTFLLRSVKVKTFMGGSLPKLGTRSHPLWNIQYPVKFQRHADGKDFLQTEAKVYLPPGGYVWRSRAHGSWEVALLPHRRQSRSWSKHGGDTFECLKHVLMVVWHWYFEDNGGMPESHCPIDGIF